MRSYYPTQRTILNYCCLVEKSCLTNDPMNYSPPGSSDHGISDEYWSGFPFPSPRDLPNPGTESVSHALAYGFFLPLIHQGNPTIFNIL